MNRLNESVIRDRTTQADCSDAGESSTEQLAAFMAKGRLKFRATAYHEDMQTAPEWAWNGDGMTKRQQYPHGLRYRVTISREGKPGRLAFDYWGSIRDRELIEKRGKAFAEKSYSGLLLKDTGKPQAYDVFGCVSSDSTCPDTFAEFCDSFGYDRDSRKAAATFKRCRTFARRINQFFSVEELATLQAIQF